MVSIPVPKSTEARLAQFSNALFPMVFMLSGTATVGRFVHPRNACAPMVSMPSPKSMVVSPVQFSNTPSNTSYAFGVASAMVFKLFGKLSDCNAVQPANACVSIVSKLVPNCTVSKWVNPLKVYAGMTFKLSPSSTFWSAEQFWNTSAPSVKTPLPTFAWVSVAQSLNA